MKNIVSILNNMWSLWRAEDACPLIDEGKNDLIRVAAGDPAQDAYLKKIEEEIPDTFELLDGASIINRVNYCSFIVDGFSMLPEGIDNGNVLLCQPVNWKLENSFRVEQFVVIKVDENYYKWKKKELRFRYKLRKTLAFVPANSSVEKLISQLKQVNDDILLLKNQRCLKEKLEEIRRYKEYQNKDLTLSVTYRSGDLRYSFHPIDLIEFVGQYCIKRNKDNSWTTVEI